MIGPSSAVLEYAPEIGHLSDTTQAPITTAAATPALTPPATAQASAGAASQVAVIGITPIFVASWVCRMAVDSSARAVMTRSPLSSDHVRRAGVAYPAVVTTVHAVITAMTAQAQPQSR